MEASYKARCFSLENLKAKYYPRGDFLSASVGSNPSYTWRNILHTRSLIKEGDHWLIGGGDKISMWCDSWVQSKTVRTPLSTVQPVSPFVHVAEFLSRDGKCWDANLVAEHVLLHRMQRRFLIYLYWNPHDILWTKIQKHELSRLINLKAYPEKKNKYIILNFI